MCIVFELILEEGVLLRHLVDESFHLHNFMRDLVYSNLVVPNCLMQLAYLMYGLLILRSQSILLVNELLVLFVKGDPLLLHFLELDCSRA